MNTSIELNNEVTQLLDGLNHPFRTEIDLIRRIILSASSELSENVKWNGPNYSVENEDRITIRVQPIKKQAQLIFHRGAKKQEQPKEKLVTSNIPGLIWKENDRAILVFTQLTAIESIKNDLSLLVKDWIQACNK